MNLLAVSKGLIADVVVVGILAIFLLVGLKKGFIKSVLSFFGTIVALIVAIIFCRQFAGFLDNKFELIDKFTSMVQKMLSGNASFNVLISAENLEESLKIAKVPGFMIGIITGLDAISSLPEGTTLATLISPVFANYILLFVSFLALFVLFKLMLLILKLFTNLIKSIKIINFVDKLLGTIMGLIQGLVLVYVLLTVVTFFPKPLKIAKEAIETSTVAKYLNDTDLIGKVLEKVIDDTKLNDKVNDIINGKKSAEINFMQINGEIYNII